MLTHLPVDGDASWARERATAEFGSAVELAEPGRNYEV
jgi:hypothetical protein